MASPYLYGAVNGGSRVVDSLGDAIVSKDRLNYMLSRDQAVLDERRRQFDVTNERADAERERAELGTYWRMEEAKAASEGRSLEEHAWDNDIALTNAAGFFIEPEELAAYKKSGFGVRTNDDGSKTFMLNGNPTDITLTRDDFTRTFRTQMYRKGIGHALTMAESLAPEDPQRDQFIEQVQGYVNEIRESENIPETVTDEQILDELEDDGGIAEQIRQGLNTPEGGAADGVAAVDQYVGGLADRALFPAASDTSGLATPYTPPGQPYDAAAALNTGAPPLPSEPGREYVRADRQARQDAGNAARAAARPEEEQPPRTFGRRFAEYLAQGANGRGIGAPDAEPTPVERGSQKHTIEARAGRAVGRALDSVSDAARTTLLNIMGVNDFERPTSGEVWDAPTGVGRAVKEGTVPENAKEVTYGTGDNQGKAPVVRDPAVLQARLDAWNANKAKADKSRQARAATLLASFTAMTGGVPTAGVMQMAANIAEYGRPSGLDNSKLALAQAKHNLAVDVHRLNLQKALKEERGEAQTELANAFDMAATAAIPVVPGQKNAQTSARREELAAKAWGLAHEYNHELSTFLGVDINELAERPSTFPIIGRMLTDVVRINEAVANHNGSVWNIFDKRAPVNMSELLQKTFARAKPHDRADYALFLAVNKHPELKGDDAAIAKKAEEYYNSWTDPDIPNSDLIAD